eukprot:2935819-Rhodomonas_salina.1
MYRLMQPEERPKICKRGTPGANHAPNGETEPARGRGAPLIVPRRRNFVRLQLSGGRLLCPGRGVKAFEGAREEIVVQWSAFTGRGDRGFRV